MGLHHRPRQQLASPDLALAHGRLRPLWSQPRRPPSGQRTVSHGECGLLLLLLFRHGCAWPARLSPRCSPGIRCTWNPSPGFPTQGLLSTFFALLTLLAYTIIAKKVEGRESRVGGEYDCSGSRLSTLDFDYTLALFFFTLGLMSKPMLVTLPFVMLLLDYWPLKRVTSDRWQVRTLSVGAREMAVLFARGGFVRRNLSCPVSTQWRRGRLPRTRSTALSVLQRIGILRALFAEMVWPVRLAVFYPLPDI